MMKIKFIKIEENDITRPAWTECQPGSDCVPDARVGLLLASARHVITPGILLA